MELSSFLPIFQTVNQRFLDVLEEVHKSIAEAFENARNFDNKHNWSSRFDDLPSAIKFGVKTLSESSWYIHGNMTLGLVQLADMLVDGQSDEVNTLMVSYFENYVDEIETRLVSQYPKRKEILKAAFRAHRQQEYFLSIPVFLSQVDGICLDSLGGQYFRKTRKNIRKKRIRSSDTFDSAFLSAFTSDSPIHASVDSNVQDEKFNRHLILHGMDCTYGTRINSFKCISLLNYFSEWVCDAKET
jgi:hypothetical protein